jgi:pimeloyl-ACP methyl ester carboxylesterase
MSPAPEDNAEFIDAAGRRLHARWLSPEFAGAPLVFLHEGLGSVELWRAFPAELVTASQHPGFVYSRYGNGWSSPLGEPRPVDYMHTEALHVLPEIIGRVVGQTPILVGHSDGASIALIYAGSGQRAEGLILLAPHVLVEPVGIHGITAIRDGFDESGLGTRMAAYHHQPETTFHGWAEVWLSPGFRSWNIEEYLPAIDCPLLLIQGEEDEYGTMKHVELIEAAVAGPVERLVVPGTGHSPHLADSESVVAAAARFIAAISAGDNRRPLLRPRLRRRR